MRRLLTGLAAGFAAALVAGVVAGAVARVLMRLLVLAGGGEPGFSWAATLGILVVFVVFMLPGCVLAALYRGRGRSLLLLLGSALLCVPATAIAREDLSELIGVTTGQWVLVFVIGAAIYAVIFAMPVLALRLIRAWAPAAAAEPSPAVPGAC